MTKPARLFLIPVTIADDTADAVIPEASRKTIAHVRHFVAEDVRSARRFLASLKIFDSIESLHLEVLDKNTKEADLATLLAPLKDGIDMGLLSEAGCPGVADPGADAVRFAHRNHLKVVPLVGPSSLLLALMASGLNGQQFAFHGYLPIEGNEAGKAIREFERESRAKNQTKIFIETPYRNERLLGLLKQHLDPATELCIACDLTSSKEFIITMPVRDWKRSPITLPRSPVVFLFLAEGNAK